MDELAHLRIFNQVARAGSFSEAARQLGLPPSSVSRHVSALEARLGVKLLLRTTRFMSLTEAGRVYHAQSQRVLTELQRANQLVSDFQSMPRGTLRIETRAGLGTRLIVPLMPDFLAAHPGLNVSLHLTDQTRDTLGEGVDVAIRFGLGRNSALTCKKILGTSRVMFASPRYIAERGEPTTPADLDRHNCLAFQSGPGPTTWRFAGPGGVQSWIVRGNFEVNDVGALVAAALRGLGISVLHEWMIWDELQTGRLVRIMPDTVVTTLEEFDTPIYMIYPASRQQPAKIRALLAFLTERLKPLQ